jgi:enoyl-CoA hydratase
MPGDEIIVKKEKNAGIVVFNRPEIHNAFNHAMLKKFDKALDVFENDQEIRTLILTGAGEKSFVSGSDIKELSKRTPLTGIENSTKRQLLLSRIEDLPIPSIAAVNGYAFGIGCEIALACTFRIASEKARFGQLEINLGIIPGAGGTQRLSRLVGKSNAAELILKGEIISAQEAYRIGLANKIVPADKLLDECLRWAETFREKSPIALKYALMSINEGMNLELDAGLMIESLSLGACFASEDSKEGLAAFLEKRKAKFKGI